MRAVSRLLTIEDLYDYAYGQKLPALVSRGLDGHQLEVVQANLSFLQQSIDQGQPIYGVTTGLGSSSKNRFDASHGLALQKNLMQYHGCGVGHLFTEPEAAAIVLARFGCLAQGRSGCGPELIEGVLGLLRQRVIPAIPCQGSVGASGDLTPLSYLAATLVGERQAFFHGELMPSQQALRQAELQPYECAGRDVLALMNGTSAMTGLAALAARDCQFLAERSCFLTGQLANLLGSDAGVYRPEGHLLKPHPGQQHAAALMDRCRSSRDPEAVLSHRHGKIQDSYSLRCAPHVIGVLFDTLAFAVPWIETELNSVNDNPVFVEELEMIINGGHFYGGHIAQACDSLKTALANVINLVDRQMALLMDYCSQGYLTENLVSREVADQIDCHHGVKAVQITLSALAAEAAKKSAPISPYSRPTETGNQDVVSLGTIAARELLELVGLAEDALAIAALMITQGFYIQDELYPELAETLSSDEWHQRHQLFESFAKMVGDRPLAADIEALKLSWRRQRRCHDQQGQS